MAEDIVRFGAPQGTHSGPTKHNHIHHVKQPAKTTQRRHLALDEQLGNRVMEHHIVNWAFQLMDHTRNPSIASDSHDALENLYRMSQNSSTEVYYLGLNDTTLQLTNSTNCRNLVSSECLSVIQAHYQSCENLLLPTKITLFTECNIQNKLY